MSERPMTATCDDCDQPCGARVRWCDRCFLARVDGSRERVSERYEESMRSYWRDVMWRRAADQEEKP